jgi:hypothetical protein
MNKIIDFNEEFGFIVVEPGVTFYDCYDYLRAKCPQYWMGCPALGWGSVVGNASQALSNDNMRYTDCESLFHRHWIADMAIRSSEIVPNRSSV